MASVRETMRELTNNQSVTYILECLAEICQDNVENNKWDSWDAWAQAAEEIRRCAQRVPRT